MTEREKLDRDFQQIILSPYAHKSLRVVARRVDRIINEELPKIHADLYSLSQSYKTLKETLEKLIGLARLEKEHEPIIVDSSSSDNSCDSDTS